MGKGSNILLIYTGGTIGMVRDPKTGALRPFNFENLLSRIPELKEFECKIDIYSFGEPIDSSNMSPALWEQLALLIQKNYEQYDGFVILHGSDTMAYTASALSFMLENLSKPVILTGSQLPIGVNRTDAKENLITTIEIAVAKTERGKAIVPEVCVYFEYKLYRGNRTHKFSSEQFEAFQSANYPALAEAGVHIKYNSAAIRPVPEENGLIIHPKMSSEVAVLKLFPGITKEIVDGILHLNNIKGVIVETFGSGNAPMDAWFIESLKKAIDEGKHLINNTQCQGGGVKQGNYEASTQLENIGMISAGDMTFEAAITKLMHLIPKNLTHDEFKVQFERGLRGELTFI